MIRIIFQLILIVLFVCSQPAKSQQKNDSAFANIQKDLYDHPDTAISKLQKLLQSQKDVDGKIKSLLFLSIAYTAKRDTDESYKTLLKAQSLIKNSKDLRTKIEMLILIAIQYQQMELYNKSFEALDEVDLLCQNTDDSNKMKYSWLGKSFAVKGMIYKSQGNLDIALQKFSSAIHNFQQAGETPSNINNSSIVYYNIGYIYHNEDQFSMAENYFKKSIAYAQKSNAKGLEAYAMKGLAENYTIQNEHERSLFYLKEAAQKSAGIGDLQLDEGIYKGLAENYLNIGEFNEYLINNEKYKAIKFEREQDELKSINSLIDQMELNKTKQINDQKSKRVIINLGLIIFCFVISGFLFLKAISKYSKNKVSKNKLAKLTIVYYH